jgi:stage II sporulation protein D
VAVIAGALIVLPAGAARAASLFYIRGGGDGHGIGMSQYGAYGYALHGESYQFILAHYYQGTALSQTNPNQTVRVLLATGAASFSGASAAGHTRLNPATTYTVKPTAGGRVELIDASGRRVGPSFNSGLTVTGRAPLDVPGHGSYRGALQFRSAGGGVETINAVGLDDYVRGVVAEEMPSGWATQALEAQAVATRTYAITATVNGDGYDLYGDTRSQAYGGVGAETASTNAAVQATRGQIVTYDGQPAVTYFFSSSGGYTESIQYAWPGATPEPWLVGVPDPYDGAGGDPYHRWGQQLSLRAAARRLGRLVQGSLEGIRIIQTAGASPHVVRAAVVGTRGSTSVSGETLQSDFGLATTYAAFTTITTRASATRLSGTIFPGRARRTYWVQQQEAGRWHTIAKEATGTGGSYTAPLPGPGRYRIRYSRLGGPAVSAP